MPAGDFLLVWAATPYQPLAGYLAFFSAKGGPVLETLSWEAGHCVGYQEEFLSGSDAEGAYVCQLTIAATTLHWQAGAPGTYLAPAAGEHGQPQQALVGGPPVAPPLPGLVLPTVEEIAAAVGKKALEELVAAASLAALPVTLTLALILGSTTSAQAPGIPHPAFPPLSPDALRLLSLEAQREERTLTGPEEAELIALLAKVRGIHVTGPQDLAYLYSRDIAFNKLWDQHASPDLRQLDLQSTLDHVEYRDYSVIRSNGVGGAHNATEWAKHRDDYVEVSRTPHPTVLGVEHVEYQIPALDRELKPTGVLKKIYTKNCL